jgi:hypothetical protein
MAATADSAEGIKKAVRLKIQGKLEKALTLYEETIAADPTTIAEDDDGLMQAMIEKYEKLAADGNAELCWKVANFCDMAGETDRSIKWYEKVAASGNAELAPPATERINALHKEDELYQQEIRKIQEQEQQEIQAQQQQEQKQNAADAAQSKDVQEQENTEKENKRNEVREKIAALEKEVAEAEEAMRKSKSDREGRGAVRSWRKKESDEGKSKYNNSFARRYREDKAAYEAKQAELDKMKQELEQIQ